MDRWLDDGATIDLGGGDRLRVVHAPGPTPDALCLWDARDSVLFAGLLVHAGAPVDVSQPESNLVQYLASLVKMRDVVAGSGEATIACGRGGLASLPAARLGDLLALVDDAITGQAAPVSADPLLFRRGDFSFEAKGGDLPGARVAA